MATIIPFTNAFGQTVSIDVDTGNVVAGDASGGQGGTQPPQPPQGGPPGFDPRTAQIGDVIRTGVGDLIYTGTDYNNQSHFMRAGRDTANVNGRLVDVATGQTIVDFSNTLSAGTAATIALQQAQLAAQRELQAAQLAERQRQFNEQFGANKAQFNIEQQYRDRQLAQQKELADQQLAQQKELALLNLGSRPDTLIRYLFAVRGQQAPQGLTQPPALPGTAGTSSPGSGARNAYVAPLVESPQSGGDPTARIPQITQAQSLATERAQQAQSLVPNSAVLIPNNLPNIGVGGQAVPLQNQSIALGKDRQGNAILQVPGGGAMPANAVVANVQTDYAGNSVPISLSNDTISRGTFNLAPYSPPAPPAPPPPPNTISGAAADVLRSFQQNIGKGLASQADLENYKKQLGYSPEQYKAAGFGDGGVIPEPVLGVGLASGQQYVFGEKGPETVVPGIGRPPRRNGVYAQGGTIGYDPSKFAPPSLFNPPQISNTFGFPQIPALTGGTSLIPSAQSLFQALPSERALYSGYLQDEAGVQAQDVFDLSRRLAPKVGPLQTPRFVN